MKTFFPFPAPAGQVSHQVHVIRRYLNRLVNGWEYARDKDLDVLDSMLHELDREIRRAGEAELPTGVVDYAAIAGRALARARASHGDARMRHLEIAAETVDSLVACLPAHL